MVTLILHTYTAHTAPLFAQLQILPYELLVKQSKLLFMHTIEYNQAPSSFVGVWTKNYVNQGDRPLRNVDNFMLPTPLTELFKKSPLYSLTMEWNILDDTRYIQNRYTFKTAIKFNLLNNVIDSIRAAQPT